MDENKLIEVIQSFKIFIDTCSLLHEGANNVFVHVLPKLLLKYKTKVIVPLKVIEEIQKHCKSKDVDLKSKAKNALKIVEEYQKYDIISIQGEKTDSFTDNLFLAVFTKFRMKYNLCLITQDNGLSEDIKKLGKTSSSVERNIKKIIILRILSNKNELSHYRFVSTKMSPRLINFTV